MKRKISGPLALLILGILILVTAALGYRSIASSRPEGQMSPEFLKLSPAEQQEALANAERIRRLRGAPSPP